MSGTRCCFCDEEINYGDAFYTSKNGQIICPACYEEEDACYEEDEESEVEE